MDWTKGYSSQYYASFVDPMTWRDIERFEITGGSVKRDDSGLMESADIDCLNFTQGERYVRLWLDARQDGDAVHTALFTGLSCCPSDDINGFRIENAVQLYSVVKPAEDVLLERGWYAPVETDGANLAKSLLSVCPAPVSIEGDSPHLANAIIAEDGETRLSMAQKILDAIGWRLRISGLGEITICPQATEPVATFDATENDILEKEIKKTFDWYDCPNVFRAVADDLSAVARDDDPDSFLSTVSRGREVWQEETDCDVAEGESIADYALRRLKEEQRVGLTAEYDRRYLPDVLPTDIVRLNIPWLGLVGNFRIASQDIELGFEAKTGEEVTMI